MYDGILSYVKDATGFWVFVKDYYITFLDNVFSQGVFVNFYENTQVSENKERISFFFVVNKDFYGVVFLEVYLRFIWDVLKTGQNRSFYFMKVDTSIWFDSHSFLVWKNCLSVQLGINGGIDLDFSKGFDRENLFSVFRV